jgi:hypothetical protein
LEIIERICASEPEREDVVHGFGWPATRFVLTYRVSLEPDAPESLVGSGVAAGARVGSLARKVGFLGGRFLGAGVFCAELTDDGWFGAPRVGTQALCSPLHVGIVATGLRVPPIGPRGEELPWRFPRGDGYVSQFRFVCTCFTVVRSTISGDYPGQSSRIVVAEWAEADCSEPSWAGKAHSCKHPAIVAYASILCVLEHPGAVGGWRSVRCVGVVSFLVCLCVQTPFCTMVFLYHRYQPGW